MSEPAFAMEKTQENPNFFRRNPNVKTNKPWLKNPDSLDHRPDYSNEGNSGAFVTRVNSCTNPKLSITNENRPMKCQNFYQSTSTVSTVKSNSFQDLKVDSMPYFGRAQRELNIMQHQSNQQNRPQIRNEKKFRSQFHKKPQFRKKLHSEIGNITENIDTDFDKCVEHQFTISDHTNTSIALPTNHQTVDINLPSIDLHTECDYNSLEITGDLKKLQIMTAVDLDQDRYARYGQHESEIKDYVRTVTYKNSLEYCAEEYIKVNTCEYLIPLKNNLF